MRRILLAVVTGLALTTFAPAPASASHPCLDLSPFTCWLTSCHTPKFCL